MTENPDSATPRTLDITSLAQCREVAKTLGHEFRQKLGEGLRVVCDGTLGSGKTTFVAFLAESLGCVDQVSSPTYVLQHLYPIPGGFMLEHWDLYRLRKSASVPDELAEPVPAGRLQLIEWGQDVSDSSVVLKFIVARDMKSRKVQVLPV